VRVIRACRELGIRAVAVYSDVDRDALHVRLADEAYPIGPASPRESYLATGKLIEVARRAKCDAVHPGYGFLSENAEFADAVRDAGLVFVGPPGDVQRKLGEKTQARRLARDAGVPVAEGTLEPLRDLDHARREAERIGYPVMLKAAGGGGGKGMRAVASVGELDAAWRLASGEAAGAFGSSALFVEKLIEKARHIEMQILADAHGGIVWLGERDCSIQRRHQKLIEEAPSPAVSESLRAEMEDAARRACESLRYRGAGTLEFLLDAEGRFSFIEMNTRLQVEHPVTELVTGIDVVRAQLGVAAEEGLPAKGAVPLRGHAIEFRINAEDPTRDFLPAPGTIARFQPPLGPGVRVDTHVFDGYTVPPFYDSLLAKVIVWAEDRPAAIARARRALSEFDVEGVPTTKALAMDIIETEGFTSGAYTTAFLAEADLAALRGRS